VNPGEPYYTRAASHRPNAYCPERRSAACLVAPAESLLPYIPAPNRGANIFSTSAYNETLRDHKGAIRIDHVTRWGALAGYYFVDDYGLDNPYPTAQGGANVPGFNALVHGPRAACHCLPHQAPLAQLRVNEFHLGYMRTVNNVGQPVGGVGPSLASQGFINSSGQPSIAALEPRIEGIENVAFNDFTIGVGHHRSSAGQPIPMEWSDISPKGLG